MLYIDFALLFVDLILFINKLVQTQRVDINKGNLKTENVKNYETKNYLKY